MSAQTNSWLYDRVRAGTIVCMKTISSAEFRKTYSQLTEMTFVTVNGHAIGYWTPRAHHDIDWATMKPITTLDPVPAFDRMTQTERDAILRRINKGEA